MEQLSDEIFNVLKGANYKVRLFTMDGKNTLDSKEATRFYCYDQDLMVSIRIEDSSAEVLVQAGQDYDLTNNANLVKILKKVTHNNLGEFTVKKFDKKIAPKDFSHQNVSESAFGKSYGSIKTSYLPSPNAKLIIKHTQKVDEEKRGARSRNIHSLFVENSAGERFNFPHKYMAGAKAMLKHVNEGGNPYDEKGKAILELCAEVSDLSKFVKHARSNKLVNENNEDIVETIKARMAETKAVIKSLSTQKGYNNFQSTELQEDSEDLVDITDQFKYNTFTAEEMQRVISRVNRIVSENGKKDAMTKELIQRLFAIIQTGNLGLNIDANDPEHPNNEDQTKYQGQNGVVAKLSAMLSFLAKRTRNDELSNVLAQLSDDIHGMSKEQKMALAKFVNFALKAPKKEETQMGDKLDESVIGDLRRKIS
jgi:hypothetical protein